MGDKIQASSLSTTDRNLEVISKLLIGIIIFFFFQSLRYATSNIIYKQVVIYEQFALFCFSTISLTVGDYIWLRVGSNINAKRSGSGNFQLSKKNFFHA